MSNISAKIVADSKNQGHRLTTFVVTFPRIILAEFNTHRMFSRNSASSRAIPFEKMMRMVRKNPFIPIAFQEDHKGMQGTKYLSGWRAKFAKSAWIFASKMAIVTAWILNKIHVTKQLCNRVLEPFMYHTVIVTSSQFENFFALRCPQYMLATSPNCWRSKMDLMGENPLLCKSASDKMFWLTLNKGQAEIHIMELAEAMWDAYNKSIPQELKAGEWHIPFDGFTPDKIAELAEKHTLQGFASSVKQELSIKIATARCARVSYTVVGEESKPHDFVADVKLHDRLAASGHFSPFEHIGRAMTGDEMGSNALWCHEHIEYGWSGNFRGFIQYRKLLPNENKM